MLVEIHFAIETPVERLKKRGFAKGIVAKDNGDILLWVAGEVNLCGAFKLTEILHP